MGYRMNGGAARRLDSGLDNHVKLISVRRVIRVRKEDAAFVYFILESYEGLTSYSTLPNKVGEPYRDLELRIPPDFVGDVDDLLARLGELAYEIRTEDLRN